MRQNTKITPKNHLFGGAEMSVFVMSLVWKRFPSGGGDMLLALALADHASDDGTKVYPSIKHLAQKTRQSERTVQYQLRRMEEMGWIILLNAGNGGRNISREYCINPNWINGAELAPVKKTTKEMPENQGGANSAPVENGASDDINGASDDTKGATDNTKGAAVIAPASNHQEPPITTIETKPAAPAIPPAPPTPTETPKKAKANPASPVLVLPDWLSESAWGKWVRHRAKVKKSALDDDSAELCIKRLAKLRAEGSDPEEVIDNSVMNGWTGLFPVKVEQYSASAGASRQGKFDPTAHVNSGVDYVPSPPPARAAEPYTIDAQLMERTA